MQPLLRFVVCAVVLSLGAAGFAQTTRPTTNPATRPAEVVRDDIRQLLGERFTSAAAGISLRVPIGGKPSRRTGVGSDIIVSYSNPEEQWTLKVSRIIYPRPTHLVTPETTQAAGVRPIAPEPGVLDAAAESQLGTIHADVLRKERINIGKNDVGLLISRYTRGPGTWLHQLALVQASDRLYYAIDFESPSLHASTEKVDVADASEQIAVELFQAMLDSIVLIDQRPIIEDTTNRVFRALSMQVNIPSRLKAIMLPEQYFLVLKNGKNVGWLAQYEEFGVRRDKKGTDAEGLIVATVSERIFEDTGTRMTVASEMFSVPDRKKGDELWVTISIAQRGTLKDHTTEWGQSLKAMRNVLLEGTHLNQARQEVPNATIAEEYKLTVTTAGKDGAKTATRELPAYYLPAAQSAMLPRLVSQREPKAYVFLVWVASEQQLIHRFIDVGSEEQVKLNGKLVRAVVIKDRIGLEGEPTFHYVTADGTYLGCFTPSDQTLLLATNLATLQTAHPGAKVKRPFSLDTPEPIDTVPAPVR